MKKIVFTSKVVLWPGDAAWHFAYLDDKQSKKLRAMPKGPRRGFGAVKVKAKIGKTEFVTSLFPMKEGPYVLPLKKSVRRAEGIDADDKIKITCTLL